jgi:hypothetical protein
MGLETSAKEKSGGTNSGKGPFLCYTGFAHHRHRIDLFQKSRYLNRNRESPRQLDNGDS